MLKSLHYSLPELFTQNGNKVKVDHSENLDSDFKYFSPVKLNH